MSRKVHISFFIFLALAARLSAQDTSVSGQVNPPPLSHKVDTGYIKFFPDAIGIEPWVSAPSFQFRIESKKDTGGRYASDFQPYLRTVKGFDITYRAISLSFGFREKADAASQGLYGKSDYTIFKFRVNSRPVVYEFYYTRFSGFSDRNSPAFEQRDSTQPFILRPDIRLQYTKLKAIYIFSKRRFSYGAAYSFSEKQLKSRSTLLAVGNVYRSKMGADSAFLAPVQRSYYGYYDSMKYLDVTGVGLGPGAARNFVWKKWFFSLGFYFMLDAQYHHAENESGRLISNGWRAAFYGDIFLSLGYNGDRFYSGFNLRGDQNLISLPFVRASTIFYNAVFCIGYRIGPPKGLGRFYDKTPLKGF